MHMLEYTTITKRPFSVRRLHRRSWACLTSAQQCSQRFSVVPGWLPSWRRRSASACRSSSPDRPWRVRRACCKVCSRRRCQPAVVHLGRPLYYFPPRLEIVALQKHAPQHTFLPPHSIKMVMVMPHANAGRASSAAKRIVSIGSK